MEIITTTRTYTIYEFLELFETARERAKSDYLEIWGYPQTDEYMESLRELAKHFDGRLSGYNINWSGDDLSFVEFDMPEMSRREICKRLKALGTYDKKTLKGHGECLLTGVGTDEDAIDGFRWAFIHDAKVRREHRLDLAGYMDRAFQSLLKAAQAECRAFYEDENFAEHCHANDYRFLVTGKMVPYTPKEKPEPKPVEHGRPGRSLLKRKGE